MVGVSGFEPPTSRSFAQFSSLPPSYRRQFQPKADKDSGPKTNVAKRALYQLSYTPMRVEIQKQFFK